MPMKKRAGASVWVDPDDAAELTDDFFDRAEIREGERVIRRGRPPLAAPKQAVTVRLEPDLLARLRAGGPGWQTRLNEAVREWLAKQPG